jgi:hypothetical protein
MPLRGRRKVVYAHHFLVGWRLPISPPGPHSVDSRGDAEAAYFEGNTMHSTRRPFLFFVGLLGLTMSLGTPDLHAQSWPFLRGDSDANGDIDLTDAVFSLTWLFVGSRPPPCLDASDVNDSGEFNISDPIFLLNHLYLGGPAPPSPGMEACGLDLTEDDLTCVYYEPCAENTGETQALMILIEYESTEGLVNFMFECHERGIQPVCIAPGMFVQEHCEVFKALHDYGLELIGMTGPLMWGMPYEEQYELISSTKESIESCLGDSLKIISTRLFGTDGTTCRIADELGIPYVFARGTTATRATVYKPEEYDVKIVSVSNMESEQWAHGSLCDFSIWSRTGTPDDFRGELEDALKHDRITPVSHTRIGGLKEAWHAVFLELFENPRIAFQSLEEFTAEPDWTLPMAQIPRNWSNPYGPGPEPLIPYDEEPNVNNPCQLNDFPPLPGSGDVGEKIVVYHNGMGPMCLEFLAFVETIDYPLEEHLINEPDFWTGLNELKTEFGSSEGVSATFGYFPIIFIQDRAFSGFNDSVRDAILELVEE